MFINREQIRIHSLKALTPEATDSIFDLITDSLDKRIKDKYFFKRISTILLLSDQVQKQMEACQETSEVLGELVIESTASMEARLNRLVRDWECKQKIVSRSFDQGSFWEKSVDFFKNLFK